LVGARVISPALATTTENPVTLFQKKNPGTLAMNLPESNRFGTPNPCPTIRASTLQHLFIRLANCQLYKISSVHKQGLTKKNARQTLVFFF
jgi:hypothetical protein